MILFSGEDQTLQNSPMTQKQKKQQNFNKMLHLWNDQENLAQTTQRRLSTGQKEEQEINTDKTHLVPQ